MRRLIIIRIVHTPADMGSMKDALRQKGIETLGKQAWEENVRRIEKFWEEVEEAINTLDLDYDKIRIFQDGMPVGGKTAIRIVAETAAKGSKNYQIIKKMIEKGARIEKTEGEELLLAEYYYIKEFSSAKSSKKEAALAKYEKAKDELIRKRDEFIAKRIDEALGEGEVGLLFIGAHHRVTSKLANDIMVEEVN